MYSTIGLSGDDLKWKIDFFKNRPKIVQLKTKIEVKIEAYNLNNNLILLKFIIFTILKLIIYLINEYFIL